MSGALMITAGTFAFASTQSLPTASAFDNTIYAIAQQSDSKILVGGAFTSYAGSPVSFFSVAAQNSKLTGVFFKPDGTKMYVVGNAGDGDGLNGVFEYNLSSAWNVRSASFLQSLLVDSQELRPTGLFFKDDGTKMYVVGSFGDAVDEYNLSSAWNISTASFLQTFSVAAQETFSQGLFFKPDGTKMYVVGAAGVDVNEYNLSSAWNVSTASFLQTFLVLNQFGNSYNPTEVFFKPDGTKMYVVDSLVDAVNEYDLSSAWNVSTASFLQTFSVAAQELNPTGLFFKPDGTKMYIVGTRYDVYEYHLSSAWNVSTASFPYPTSRFARLMANDTLDTGFNLGTGMFDGQINAIALQSDGKILVGGLFSQFNGVTRNRLVRFNADGTEDTAFNNNLGTGFIYNTTYNPGYVQTICIQSDGKILVGGYFQDVNGAFINHLVRLNADGTRDNTFGLNLGYLNSTVMTIAVQSNGLIVIGGFFSYVHDGSSTQGRYGIAWLNSSGEQQSTPYLAIANRVMAYVYAISAQPDGKILVGGSFTTIRFDRPRNRLVRFNADGTEDTAFYTNMGTAFNNIVNAIAQQADGKILVGGEFTTFNGNTRNYLVRLNANGTEDTGFTVGTGFNNIVRAIAVQSDGKILVGGQFTQYNGTSQNYIARLTSSGLIS
jgi:uncharacterized delta-60 repeat protein